MTQEQDKSYSQFPFPRRRAVRYVMQRLTSLGFSLLTSTTTVFYKMAHLADNRGNTKPLEGQ